MAQKSITLKAGELTTAGLQGAYLTIMDLGTSGALEVAMFGTDPNRTGEFEMERITEVPRWLQIDASPGRFTKLQFRALNDCTIKIIVGDGRVRISAPDGTGVNATIVGPLPVPVQNDRGSLANPVYVSGLTYTDAPATGAADAAPVAVTSAGVAVLAANANRKSARFLNLGPDQVAIVPPGGTWARRVHVLEVGDIWVEERGPNLAWDAITDAGKNATVTALEVNA